MPMSRRRLRRVRGAFKRSRKRVSGAVAKKRHGPVSMPTPGSRSDDLIEEFNSHVQRWKKETRHFSSLSAMISHPSYRRIMGMGREGLPLLFRELNRQPEHWLVALSAMTGVDPVPQ